MRDLPPPPDAALRHPRHLTLITSPRAEKCLNVVSALHFQPRVTTIGRTGNVADPRLRNRYSRQHRSRSAKSHRFRTPNSAPDNHAISIACMSIRMSSHVCLLALGFRRR